MSIDAIADDEQQHLERMRIKGQDPEVQAFYAERKAAAAKIDPAKCDWGYFHADLVDPYGINPYGCIGKALFVWSPDSDGWIDWTDLPEEAQEVLKSRIKAEQETSKAPPPGPAAA